jgi:hypothetical protein
MPFDRWSPANVLQDVAVQVADSDCFNVGMRPGSSTNLLMRHSTVSIEGQPGSLGIKLLWGSGELTNVKVVAP